MHTIKEFENFIYGCDNILDNTGLDLVKWEPNYILAGSTERLSKQEQIIFEGISEEQRIKNIKIETKRLERWGQRSFYANGVFKTAQKSWNNTGESIRYKAHLSKTNIKHIIYVEKNTVVIEHLKKEIEKICERITKFEKEHKVFAGDFMANNPWFIEFGDLVFEYKAWFKELIAPLQDVLSPLQNQDTVLSSVVIKPAFKPEVVQIIFDLLKDFFSKEQQSQLKKILETGGDANEPLIFLDNGNRLGYGLKELKESDFITGCDKKDLEKWICKNFKYCHRKIIKAYTPDYIEKIISKNVYPCKRPLFKILSDNIVKA